MTLIYFRTRLWTLTSWKSKCRFSQTKTCWISLRAKTFTRASVAISTTSWRIYIRRRINYWACTRTSTIGKRLWCTNSNTWTQSRRIMQKCLALLPKDNQFRKYTMDKRIPKAMWRSTSPKNRVICQRKTNQRKEGHLFKDRRRRDRIPQWTIWLSVSRSNRKISWGEWITSMDSNWWLKIRNVSSQLRGSCSTSP